MSIIHTKATMTLAGIFVLSLFIITGCSDNQNASNLSSAEPEIEDNGLLDVTRFLETPIDTFTIAGADSESVNDSTEGINNALQQAMEQNKVLFFPAGTYYVSDTILGSYESDHDRYGGSHTPDHTFVMVGDTSTGVRPVIKLIDNAAGFQDPGSHKPVVRLRHRASGVEQEDCAFGFGFRNIDIDLGESNEGAVGLHFDAAQDSFVEDVRIEARDGFAGITALPGRSAASQNIEIVGGQYGLYLKGTSLGATLVGLVLKGQKQQAIVSSVFRGLSITGFQIEAENGPVIIQQGGDGQASHIGLFDGSISLLNPGLAIDNDAERAIAVRDVYFQNAEKIIKIGGDDLIGNPNGWKRLKFAVYCPDTLTGAAVDSCWKLIDGVKTRDDPGEMVDADGAPETLVSRHVWSGPPAYLDPVVTLVTEHGATPDDGIDDTAAIQAAIAFAAQSGGNAVFLPAGIYDMTAPIMLGSETQLFGVPGRRSVLRAMDSWQPTEQAWIVETVDDPKQAPRSSMS